MVQLQLYLLAQFLLFLIHAFYERKINQIPSILVQSIFGGLLLGLTFDLVFGKLFGGYSYAVGFGLTQLGGEKNAVWIKSLTTFFNSSNFSVLSIPILSIKQAGQYTMAFDLL